MDDLRPASECIPPYDLATTAIVRTDEEISRQISAHLTNLYIRTNSVSFVHRLPSETLEAVFIHCAYDYHCDNGFPISTAPSWVNVSYVCRRWRDVALNYPTLWTYLVTMPPRWMEEFLARSMQASLKLYVYPDRENNGSQAQRFLEQVMNHAERIQELRLHLPFACGVIGHKLFHKLSSRRAPRLQYLEISTDGPSLWSQVLFNGDTPALRTLDLFNCPLPWYSFKLSGVTTLNLSCVPVQFQQNTAELLATLGCMPDLSHLYLEDALASAASFISSPSFNAIQKIHLPHLSRLLIVAPLSTVIVLLSHINIPLQTEVRLSCDSERHSSLEDYTQLCSLLVQRFCTSEGQTLSSPIIRSLVVASAEWGGWGGPKLTFSASERDWDAFLPVLVREWGCNIPLHIILPFGQSTTKSDRDRIISQICCSIPLSNVRSVHVFDPSFSLAFWTHILGNLQAVRHIKLSHGLMPNLASLLSLTPRNRTEDSSGGFAPGLEGLELDDIVFSTTLEGCMDPFEVADVQSLCDALSTRQEPRGRLTMTRCTERSSDRQESVFSMTGWWGGGRFNVVDKHESDTP